MGLRHPSKLIHFELSFWCKKFLLLAVCLAQSYQLDWMSKSDLIGIPSNSSNVAACFIWVQTSDLFGGFFSGEKPTEVWPLNALYFDLKNLLEKLCAQCII